MVLEFAKLANMWVGDGNRACDRGRGPSLLIVTLMASVFIPVL